MPAVDVNVKKYTPFISYLSTIVPQLYGSHDAKTNKIIKTKINTKTASYHIINIIEEKYLLKYLFIKLILAFLKFKKTNLIIDPWLKGDLIFPPGKWFFKGSLENEIPISKDLDLILLTQGLSDHCHIPTLEMFKKDIPIICPKSAEAIVKKLGFSSIKILKPEDSTQQNGLCFRATAGAPVPQIENGYIVKDKKGNGFYIEPHGYLDENLETQTIDAVITPTKDLNLPLVGSFVKGAEVIPKLINTFNPKYILILVTIFLFLGCFWLSKVSSSLELLFCFAIMRTMGQGALSLIPSTLVSIWFTKKRALALAIMGLGISASSGFFPVYGAFLIENIGWRDAWLVLGITCLLYTSPSPRDQRGSGVAGSWV